MAREFRLPIGLAVMVVLALVGALSIFSFSAVQPTETSNFDTGNIARVRVAPHKLVDTPMATSVSTATAAQSPVTPGAPAVYTFRFVTSSELTNGEDEIVITFDNEYGVPSVIPESGITIRADNVTGGGAPGEAVNPEVVNVVFVSFRGAANDEPEVTLRVPDVATDTGSGDNGIASGASVTVVFRQSAGITNPTESGSDPIDIRTTQDIDDVEALNPTTNARVFTPVVIEMDRDDGKRGDELTVVALGVEGNESATFWLDGNGDGVRQAGEFDLCAVVADSNGIATCAFTISNPPFIRGSGDDCTLPALSNCNYINVIDGQARTTTGSLSTTLDQQAVDRQTLELEPTVDIAPSSADAGDVI